MASNLNGPDFTYRPDTGDSSAITRRPGVSGSSDYHDIDILRRIISVLKHETSQLIQDTEVELKSKSLIVREEDRKLKLARESEWDSTLGSPSGTISYAEYVSLQNQTSNTSMHMRKCYEDCMRGPSGSNALDINKVANLIRNEVVRVERFLEEYIGDVNDSSEFRVVELFQDWVQSAISHTRKFRALFLQEQENPIATIPENEVQKLNRDQARNYQALFKTKTNVANNRLVDSWKDLEKQFGTLSDVFYDKFLGPGLKYRLKFGRNFDGVSIDESFLESQARSANDALAKNFQTILGDLAARNHMFNISMMDLHDRLVLRDSYNGFITQLEGKGSRVRPLFSEEEVNPDHIQHFTQVAEERKKQTRTDESSRSSHYDLADLDVDGAHPQYLLRSGGTVFGDIEFEDGVTIDGVDPSTHAHTGADGSEQISALDLLPGTLQTALIDSGEFVCRPEDLRIATLTTRTVGSQQVVDAEFAWDCDNDGVFDFEVVPISTGVASVSDTDTDTDGVVAEDTDLDGEVANDLQWTTVETLMTLNKDPQKNTVGNMMSGAGNGIDNDSIPYPIKTSTEAALTELDGSSLSATVRASDFSDKLTLTPALKDVYFHVEVGATSLGKIQTKVSLWDQYGRFSTDYFAEESPLTDVGTIENVGVSILDKTSTSLEWVEVYQVSSSIYARIGYIDTAIYDLDPYTWADNIPVAISYGTPTLISAVYQDATDYRHSAFQIANAGVNRSLLVFVHNSSSPSSPGDLKYTFVSKADDSYNVQFTAVAVLVEDTLDTIETVSQLVPVEWSQQSSSNTILFGTVHGKTSAVVYSLIAAYPGAVSTDGTASRIAYHNTTSYDWGHISFAGGDRAIILARQRDMGSGWADPNVYYKILNGLFFTSVSGAFQKINDETIRTFVGSCAGHGFSDGRWVMYTDHGGTPPEYHQYDTNGNGSPDTYFKVQREGPLRMYVLSADHNSLILQDKCYSSAGNTYSQGVDRAVRVGSDMVVFNGAQDSGSSYTADSVAVFAGGFIENCSRAKIRRLTDEWFALISPADYGEALYSNYTDTAATTGSPSFEDHWANVVRYIHMDASGSFNKIGQPHFLSFGSAAGTDVCDVGNRFVVSMTDGSSTMRTLINEKNGSGIQNHAYIKVHYRETNGNITFKTSQSLEGQILGYDGSSTIGPFSLVGIPELSMALGTYEVGGALYAILIEITLTYSSTVTSGPGGTSVVYETIPSISIVDNIQIAGVSDAESLKTTLSNSGDTKRYDLASCADIMELEIGKYIAVYADSLHRTRVKGLLVDFATKTITEADDASFYLSITDEDLGDFGACNKDSFIASDALFWPVPKTETVGTASIENMALTRISFDDNDSLTFTTYYSRVRDNEINAELQAELDANPTSSSYTALYVLDSATSGESDDVVYLNTSGWGAGHVSMCERDNSKFFIFGPPVSLSDATHGMQVSEWKLNDVNRTFYWTGQQMMFSRTRNGDSGGYDTTGTGEVIPDIALKSALKLTDGYYAFVAQYDTGVRGHPSTSIIDSSLNKPVKYETVEKALTGRILKSIGS